MRVSVKTTQASPYFSRVHRTLHPEPAKCLFPVSWFVSGVLCGQRPDLTTFLSLADPWLWNEQQVCQWLLWATNEFSLVNVNLQRFGMNGQVLCNLGKERFLELAPDFVGDILWEHLEQMIKGGAGWLSPRYHGGRGHRGEQGFGGCAQYPR